jgi:TPR repeat protein
MQSLGWKRTDPTIPLLLAVVLAMPCAVQGLAEQVPDVPEHYKKYFAHYADDRSITETILNTVDVTLSDVGRSFALIAGVSHYPNMPIIWRELKPAEVDVDNLRKYLEVYESFDEIVILKDGDVTTANFEFFLQSYFPERLKKFPKSRFLFAFSGHGMTDGAVGYILKNTARNLADKSNGINLNVVRVYIDEVIRSGHHVLVLLNACYCGAFLQRPFGDERRFLPRYPGAHAITAGGTGERTWHIPKIGPGSVFFEKVLAGLDGKADSSRDGIIGVYELYAYLRTEIPAFTDQVQNPQVGDLSKHGSRGEFFFLNRDRQVEAGIVPTFDPERAEAFAIGAESLLKEGLALFAEERYDTALELFRQSAERGNMRAMYYVGHIYDMGLGVTRDYAYAFVWYSSAADAGDANAMNNLGYMFDKGLGVPKDPEKAVYWYRRAAEKQNAEAMYNLGCKYEQGSGIARDYGEAARWYLEAAEAGETAAMNNVGTLYRAGLGVARDYQEAKRWFLKAAEAGEVSAMLNLASLYMNGTGLRRDFARARRWFLKAAEGGSSEAMYYLGLIYDDGLGVPRNRREARRWYEKAARVGSEDAVNRLKELGE